MPNKTGDPAKTAYAHDAEILEHLAERVVTLHAGKSYVEPEILAAALRALATHERTVHENLES
jgi:hypothetical protein